MLFFWCHLIWCYVSKVIGRVNCAVLYSATERSRLKWRHQCPCSREITTYPDPSPIKEPPSWVMDLDSYHVRSLTLSTGVWLWLWSGRSHHTPVEPSVMTLCPTVWRKAVSQTPMCGGDISLTLSCSLLWFCAQLRMWHQNTRHPMFGFLEAWNRGTMVWLYLSYLMYFALSCSSLGPFQCAVA